MTDFINYLLNGLSLGCIYALIAIGYSMVYGIIGMINFAHGEIYMIGAFLTVIVFTLLGMIGLTWVPLALLTVLHDGRFATFSPELAGQPNAALRAVPSDSVGSAGVATTVPARTAAGIAASPV